MIDNWLENLKPGDEVFVETAYPESPERLAVDRLSRDKIHLVGTLAVFRRSDGSCITWTGYDAPTLHPLTDELQMRNWLKQQILAELRHAKYGRCDQVTRLPSASFRRASRSCCRRRSPSMAEVTKIQWCDHTFNPWRIAKGTRIVAAERSWKQPAKWHVAAQRDGVRRKVFCASLADVFEEWEGVLHAPNGAVVGCDDGELATMDDVRRRLFDLIDATPWLDWLVLTKRPENVRRMWPVRGVSTDGTTTACMGPPPIGARNVWLLTSVSDQQTADAMVPPVLACRDLVPVLGLSCEPLVGPVDLSRWLGLLTYSRNAVIRMQPHGATYPDPRAGTKVKTYPAKLDWVIVGGESGPNARPCDVAWIRSIVGQCKAANVPCFVKQLGAKPREVRGDELWGLVGLRDPKGGDPAEWPEDLRVQEFPKHA